MGLVTVFLAANADANNASKTMTTRVTTYMLMSTLMFSG